MAGVVVSTAIVELQELQLRNSRSDILSSAGTRWIPTYFNNFQSCWLNQAPQPHVLGHEASMTQTYLKSFECSVNVREQFTLFILAAPARGSPVLHGTAPAVQQHADDDHVAGLLLSTLL
jgi:hypothetical protein